MDERMNALAEQVRTERRRKKLTQRQVAEATGVSLGAVSNFERKKTSLQGANLRAILTFLEIAPEGGGDEVAEETRAGWPVETSVFLDVIGAWLDTMDEPTRMETIHTLTRRIINGNIL